MRTWEYTMSTLPIFDPPPPALSALVIEMDEVSVAHDVFIL